jgi:predicted phage terminase large subunit-like protein
VPVRLRPGKVLEQAPWLEAYREEMTSFPNARHDDQVDATAIAMLRLSNVAAQLRAMSAPVLDAAWMER